MDDVMYNINICPFCKKSKVEFVWTSFMVHGRVQCTNWEDKCCAQGPQAHYKKYDNEKRIIVRAIKKWNKATS